MHYLFEDSVVLLELLRCEFLHHSNRHSVEHLEHEEHSNIILQSESSIKYV